MRKYVFRTAALTLTIRGDLAALGDCGDIAVRLLHQRAHFRTDLAAVSPRTKFFIFHPCEYSFHPPFPYTVLVFLQLY